MKKGSRSFWAAPERERAAGSLPEPSCKCIWDPQRTKPSHWTFSATRSKNVRAATGLRWPQRRSCAPPTKAPLCLSVLGFVSTHNRPLNVLRGWCIATHSKEQVTGAALQGCRIGARSGDTDPAMSQPKPRRCEGTTRLPTPAPLVAVPQQQLGEQGGCREVLGQQGAPPSPSGAGLEVAAGRRACWSSSALASREPFRPPLVSAGCLPGWARDPSPALASHAPHLCTMPTL